jgi:pimeloyl-ACP methyl ester carboxylesterase
MQRPIMNPAFFEDPEGPAPPARWRVWLHRAAVWGRALARVALRRPFMRPPVGPPAPLWYRIAAGLLYRLTVGLTLAAIAVVAILTAATHPRTADAAGADPGASGIYYDPVSFLSSDGVRLDAWLIPALDAQRIVQQGDQALRQKRPAVILVHDYAQSRRQMLPLIRPLHQAGFNVLALSLRGCGSSGASPQTFGLRESLDVRAAAEMLRRRPFIDPHRIAALGLGTGANAVLLAARGDPDLRTLILQNPFADFNEVLDHYILPPALQYDWLQTAFRWTFQTIYRVDAEALASPDSRPEGVRTLILQGGLPGVPGAAAQVCRFLQASLQPDRPG